MRALPALAALALLGCAGATSQPPETYHAAGEARAIASCAYRRLQDGDGTFLQLTPLDDTGGAELVAALPVCGLLGCLPDRVLYDAHFEPDAPGRTRIVIRGHPTIHRLGFHWRTRIGPAVEACSTQAGAAAAAVDRRAAPRD